MVYISYVCTLKNTAAAAYQPATNSPPPMHHDAFAPGCSAYRLSTAFRNSG